MSTTISVITICFNNQEELISTCQSVDEQTCQPDEHLIIDGSTNNSILNWLKTNPQPRFRKWIHEEDNGIADAFNKGINNSTGELIHLLNSGDTYYQANAIQTALDAFDNNTGLKWLHSKYVQFRGGILVISGKPFDQNLLWKGMRQVAHPSMFLKKELYVKHGLFDTSLKIAMDYDLLVRIRNEENIFLDQPLVCFAPGGASSQQFYLGLKEVKNIYQKYMGNSNRQHLWQTRQKILHVFMQTGLGKLWFVMKNKNKKVF